MKALIVDNNSKHTDELTELVRAEGYDADILRWDDPNLLKAQDGCDIIILSGGKGLAVPDHRADLAAEINLVKNSAKPIIGICLGFQIITDSYGGEMIRKDLQEKGLTSIEVISPEAIFEHKKSFNAFVAHKWHVINMPQEFKILAKSGDTIEAVKHITKPIYGFQFHPEVIIEGNEGTEIFKNVLRSL